MKNKKSKIILILILTVISVLFIAVRRLRFLMPTLL